MPTSVPLVRHFRSLKDPRIVARTTHSLQTILVITICAVIAGADDFQQVAVFAQKRKDWLARFLDLSNGLPSHDTYERVFARLDPVAFQKCFTRWMTAWYTKRTGKQLAIDGKAACGSARPSKGFRALHLVNVWATQADLCLGLVACDEDSNEITAIPRLLELLDLEGALVSLDAGGCQKKIAEQIIEQDGDYLMVVKKNQEALHDEVEAHFRRKLGGDFKGPGMSSYEKEEQGHGRWEERLVVVSEDLEGIAQRAKWPELKVIGMCYSQRKVGSKDATSEVRYFIGSKKAKARYYAKGLRNHWRVENNLHWRLDVVFGEDGGRVRQRNAAANLAVVRRLALNLLTQEKTEMSVAKKRFAAALDTDYLEQILKV
jgi:predicted transposase YbfD/YdcC